MHIAELFNQYGYGVLFVLLALELVALPIPGETMMTYCGILVQRGDLNWAWSVLMATAGVICGITLSYGLGYRLGRPFFDRYGHYIHLPPERLERAGRWFARYGDALILVAYFIPGVRHVTGYFSGISRISFRRFALFAYIGAAIWTTTFISLGSVLGARWEHYRGFVERYLMAAVIAGGLIVMGVFTVRMYRDALEKWLIRQLNRLTGIFHYLGRLRMAIALLVSAGIALSVLMVWFVREMMQNEFSQLDRVGMELVRLMVPDRFHAAVQHADVLTSLPVLGLVTVLLIGWVIVRKGDRRLETLYLLAAFLGGEALSFLLNRVFHHIGQVSAVGVADMGFGFPSTQGILAVSVYGFCAFLIARHYQAGWIRPVLAALAVGFCGLAGLGAVYTGHHYPTSVIAGYLFGGIWLCVVIVLLEVSRVLPQVEYQRKYGKNH